MRSLKPHLLAAWLMLLLACLAPALAADPPNARTLQSEADLRNWLTNMIVYHGFSHKEAAAATGLSAAEVQQACQRFELEQGQRPKRGPNAPLRVLPYPGGRHPRIGFLDGAVNPQRETKASVFLPWDAASYVVLDIPEAIWWKEGDDRELLYLAHTHVPTVWTKQNIRLKPLEWSREKDGSLRVERTLPNRVTFGTHVIPHREWVEMKMWIKNGTDQPLTGLRVQNCVMFKAARGFAEQSNDNKVFRAPYAACRSGDGKRWVISAWTHCVRAWGNQRCPCMHSDPQFPDCPPGETRELRGMLSFYEGEAIASELERLDRLNWQKTAD